MLLSDFFTAIQSSELESLVIGNRNGNGIEAADYPKLVSHINLGLTALHTRLLLREEEVFLQQYDHIQLYQLHPRYALTNTTSTEPTKYIVDSVFQPFLGNVLKIEQVFSEIGVEYPINDQTNRLSVHTPRFDTLQVPFAATPNALSVLYRANHPKLSVGVGFDPTQVELEIPDAVTEALLLYVGVRAFTANGSENSKNDVNLLLSRYELACQRLENLDLLHSSGNANLRMRDKGWV